jgi:hypothetical protein
VNIIQHRQAAAAAMAKIDAARTPHEKKIAREEGVAVHAALAKFIADDNALKAISAARPQNSAGMFSGEPVFDHPVFMVRADGTKITAPVVLPGGSKAAPNAAYQITVPAHFVAAMMARGYVRANSVITALGDTFPDPARPNNT